MQNGVLRCPKCLVGQVHTTNTRHVKYGVYRRRECHLCKHKWSTIEIEMTRLSTLVSKQVTDELSKKRELLMNYVRVFKEAIERMTNDESRDTDVVNSDNTGEEAAGSNDALAKRLKEGSRKAEGEQD